MCRIPFAQPPQNLEVSDCPVCIAVQAQSFGSELQNESKYAGV
jgi:hypothetical protein